MHQSELIPTLLCMYAASHEWIDIDDWRKNTIYKGGCKETDDVIIWFWKVSSAKLQNLIFH